jgi:hypothetical protein
MAYTIFSNIEDVKKILLQILMSLSSCQSSQVFSFLLTKEKKSSWFNVFANLIKLSRILLHCCLLIMPLCEPSHLPPSVSASQRGLDGSPFVPGHTQDSGSPCSGGNG